MSAVGPMRRLVLHVVLPALVGAITPIAPARAEEPPATGAKPPEPTTNKKQRADKSAPSKEGKAGARRAESAEKDTAKAARDKAEAPASVDTATREQKSKAEKAFKKAMRDYKRGRRERALRGFRDSYDIVRSPNAELMIGVVLADSGKPVEAYTTIDEARRAAEELAAKDAKYRQTVDTANSELKDLAPKVGLVTVTIPNPSAGTTLSVAGQSIDSARWDGPIAVLPGHASVVVTFPDGNVENRELDVAAGASASVTVEAKPTAVANPYPQTAPSAAGTARAPLSPPPAAEPSKQASHAGRTWAWIATGVGVAGLTTFAVFGILDNAAYSELDTACPNGHCPPDRGQDIDSGKRYQLVANIGLGVGIAGVALGTVLFASSGGHTETGHRDAPSGSPPEGRRPQMGSSGSPPEGRRPQMGSSGSPPEGRRPQNRPSAALIVGPGSVSLKGTF